MSEITTTNLRIQIKDIEIDDHYYSFAYRVLIEDRIHTDWETMEDDHSWGNEKKKFKKTLMTGYAVQLVLEQIQIAK